jgi:Tfp pilus assembly protein PilO
MNSKAKSMHLTLVVTIVISATLSLGLILAGWYFVYGLSMNLSKTKTEANYLRKEADALGDLEIAYRRNETNRELALDSLPQNKNLSSFLADVETIAQDNGLKITETTIGGQASGSKSKVQNDEFSQTVKKEGYLELPLKITFTGSYRSFTNLISRVNSLRRVISISGIEAQKVLSEESKQTDEVKAIIDLSIFVRK